MTRPLAARETPEEAGNEAEAQLPPWGTELGRLVKEDAALGPSQYFDKLVEKFPDLTKAQVKNRLSKIRRRLEVPTPRTPSTVADEADDAATEADEVPVTGPGFLLFGDRSSDDGGQNEKSTKGEEIFSCACPDSTVTLAEGVDWEIRESCRYGGLGVFATKDIPAGEVVLLERALFEVKQSFDFKALQREIHTKFAALEEADKAAALELHDFSEAFFEAVGRGKMIAAPHLLQFFGGMADDAKRTHDTKIDIEKHRAEFDRTLKTTPVGIFMTNSIISARDPTMHGLLLKMSRFNWSCAPNATKHLPRRASKSTTSDLYCVATVRPIKAGEEITVPLVNWDSQESFGSNLISRCASERREYMEQCFGTPCCCEACEPRVESGLNPTCAVVVSDHYRQKLTKLFDSALTADTAKATQKNARWGAIEANARTILDLMRKENWIEPEVVLHLATEVYECALKLPVDRAGEEGTKLVFWARCRYEAMRFLSGESDEGTQKCKRDTISCRDAVACLSKLKKDAP